MRKVLTVGIILLFISASVVSGFDLISNPKPLSRGTWFYVGGSGPGNYTRIQDAIDNASDGDTIFVYSGTYFENVVINKDAISLMGEDRNTTIIDGGGTGDVVYISAYGENISGFTIQHSGGAQWVDAGIDVYTNWNNISGNIVKDNGLYGIQLTGSSRNIIYGNLIHNNYDDGISILYSSNYNTILNNTVDDNLGDGISIKYSSDNLVSQNIITNNHNNAGIVLYNSANNNTVCRNIIANYFQGIISKFSADNNIIYHNNFINNTQSYSECNNIWFNLTRHEGNYWSDYSGTDTNDDGIGDIPYNISGGDNQDLYPLMHPFEMYYILNISLDNHEVNEGSPFNVTVKTLGGTIVPNAQVSFNDELKLTNSSGMVQFTAPQVSEDTAYQIDATKLGYTSDSDSILVKDVTQEYARAFIFGIIVNLTTVEDTIMFEAVNIKVITFQPFSFIPYMSGEQFMILNTYKGFVGYRFILALCEIVV